MLESKYKIGLVARLKALYPGAILFNNDPEYNWGFPDLTMLWGKRWATFEVKQNKNSPRRPNQPYYVALLNDMSYSSMVYQSNELEVLHALEQSFRT